MSTRPPLSSRARAGILWMTVATVLLLGAFALGWRTSSAQRNADGPVSATVVRDLGRSDLGGCRGRVRHDWQVRLEGGRTAELSCKGSLELGESVTAYDVGDGTVVTMAPGSAAPAFLGAGLAVVALWALVVWAWVRRERGPAGRPTAGRR